MKPGQGAVRGGRVLAFALSAVALGSAAHVAAGGEIPLLGVAVALPLVMIAINALAARRRGLAVLAPAMAGVQAMLHVAFMATDRTPAGRVGPACTEARQVSAPGLTHGHDLVVSCGGMTGMSLSAGMLLAHVVAAGLLVLVLARGEAALWALADWLRFRVRAFSVRPWVPEPGGSPSPIIDGDVPVLLEQPGSRFTRRGPPVGAAA